VAGFSDLNMKDPAQQREKKRKGREERECKKRKEH